VHTDPATVPSTAAAADERYSEVGNEARRLARTLLAEPAGPCRTPRASHPLVSRWQRRSRVGWRG